MVYDKVTRLLHWGFALLIPLQLLSEEFMKRPKPGRIRDDMQVFFFDMHEWVGMILLVVIVSHFVWVFISKDLSWARLYPYFSAQARAGLKQQIINDVPGWFKGKIADPSHESYLAGAVHGLGLLLVLAMGFTGAVMLYGMEDSGQMLGLVHEAKELHEGLGGLLWAYLIAHIGMTVIHKLLGHKIFSRIFSFQG